MVDLPAPAPTSVTGASKEAPPVFDAAFRERFEALLSWRRDVRRFRTDPLDETEIRGLVELAALSPSVGNSQPWRFVNVRDPARRAAITADFEHCNAEALASYAGERAKVYASLKLAGLRDAPMHLAVFCDEAAKTGHGLGRRTMPETLHYSAVMAVHSFWLLARARGLGVGWVSILEPPVVTQVLDVPAEWTFIAYLCVGWPVEEHCDPELVRHGWQERLPFESFFFER